MLAYGRNNCLHPIKTYTKSGCEKWVQAKYDVGSNSGETEVVDRMENHEFLIGILQLLQFLY